MEQKELKRDYQLEKVDSGYRGSFSAMASPCEVLIETDDSRLASDITAIVAGEAWRIEQKFSRYRKDNILYKIHHANGKKVKVDEEFSLLLNF